MKRVIQWAFVLLAISLGLAATAVADTIEVTFTGVNGDNQGGYYISPYYGFLTDKHGKKTDVDLACDDFLHEITWGETWTATVSTFQDLSQVRFQAGTPSLTFQRYGEMAWLLEQMSQNPSQAGDIQFALWSIPDPAVQSQPGFTPGSAHWLTLAENKTYTPGGFWRFEILTPTDPTANSAQEMFIERPTPEPASLALFGTGLLGLAAFVRKLRK